MKKRIYLGMLALCLALTATACGRIIISEWEEEIWMDTECIIIRN